MTLNRIRHSFVQINLFCMFILQTVVNCDIDARVSLKVQGTGFHRDLMYQVHFDRFIEECYVAIYLQLPSALYANVNELAHLKRVEISTACSVGETDVELFAEKAQTQSITVCAPLTNTECNLTIPIHQRYQYPNENEKYINITLPKPKLLLGCKKRIRDYRISKIDLCSLCAEFVPKWREIPCVMDVEEVWTIPVGETNILSIVTYVTLSITILCTIFLTRTIVKTASKNHLKTE